MEDDNAPPYKIVLLGDSSVGKTSLVHRFTKDSFDQYTANTIGAAFITKIHSGTKTDRKVKFEIWDTAGQERYRSLTPMYYRNAQLALVCFDLSNVETSFARAKYWIEQLPLQGGSEIRIKVVGNKSDLISEDPDALVQVEDYCSSNELALYKTSAKTGDGIARLFADAVDEIDDDFFRKWDDQLNQDQGQMGINLSGSGFTGSGCC